MPAHPRVQRVTMLDIAKALNVDQSTVSLALRDHPRISVALRERIKTTAQEMGYQPDPMLSALAHYRRSNVEKPVTAELAWINRWSSPADLRKHREFDAYWRGAFEEAKINGYYLEEFQVGCETSLVRLNNILKARNIQGVLIPPHPKIMDWSGMEWDRYATIRFGYSIPNLPVHAIVADQMSAGQLGFHKAIEKGYRRVGFVIGSYHVWGSKFAAGFLFAQSEKPDAFHVPILSLDETNHSQALNQLHAWIDQYSVDAIFTPIASMRTLLCELGYDVPGQIGLASTSVLDCDCDTGIEQNSFELGRIAVSTLIAQINQSQRGIPNVWHLHSAQVRWVDGICLPEREIAKPANIIIRPGSKSRATAA